MSADELHHAHHDLRSRLESAYAEAQWDEAKISAIADQLCLIEKALCHALNLERRRPIASTT